MPNDPSSYCCYSLVLTGGEMTHPDLVHLPVSTTLPNFEHFRFNFWVSRQRERETLGRVNWISAQCVTGRTRPVGQSCHASSTHLSSPTQDTGLSRGWMVATLTASKTETEIMELLVTDSNILRRPRRPTNYQTQPADTTQLRLGDLIGGGQLQLAPD